MGPTGGSVKNTASGLPAPVVVDQARRQARAGAGMSECMPFFATGGLSDAVRPRRNGSERCV